jgi:hypothetical protein
LSRSDQFDLGSNVVRVGPIHGHPKLDHALARGSIIFRASFANGFRHTSTGHFAGSDSIRVAVSDPRPTDIPPSQMYVGIEPKSDHSRIGQRREIHIRLAQGSVEPRSDHSFVGAHLTSFALT